MDLKSFITLGPGWHLWRDDSWNDFKHCKLCDYWNEGLYSQHFIFLATYELSQ